MDPLTQGLLGATMAQLGFRQRIGRDASWLALLAAMAPDLDVMTGPVVAWWGLEPNPFQSLVWHRGVSHSLLAVPVMALPIAWVWWRVRPRSSGSKTAPTFYLCFACIFVAILSHPLLDGCTAYGTQLFAPISNRRFALNAVPIIDLIYTSILISTLVGTLLIRKVKASSKRMTVKFAWCGFLLSAAYLATGFFLGQRAMGTFADDFPDNLHASQYHAYPYLGTIFIWRVTRLHQGKWSTAKVNVLFPPDQSPATITYAQNADNLWVDRAGDLEGVQIFQWFSMEQIRTIYAFSQGKHIVEFHDMRYGLFPESSESLWMARVIFDANGACFSVKHAMNHRRQDATLADLAHRIWQNHWMP